MSALADEAAPYAPGRADWRVPATEATVFSDRRHRHALIIPVINEGDRIRRQLEAIARLAPALDVVVADGGSTDGSLEPAHLRSCGVRALLVKRGPGRLSAQLRMAYAWALEQGYDGVVTIDGNGKDGVEALPAFVAALEDGADYVQGSRYRKGGAAVNTPADRKLAGRLIHAPLLSAAAGRWFTDTTNGFRAYSRRLLTDPRVRPFREAFDRYALLFYLTARAGQLGYDCREVPVRRSYPEGEATPTKIAGWAGRLSLMGELLRAVLGGYRPGGGRPFDEPESRGEARGRGMVRSLPGLALLAVLFVIVLARARGLWIGHDPWIDEAMLIANLPVASLGALFAPLPLYDQAAPLGYLAVASVLAEVFAEDRIFVLRVLSVAASLGAAAFLLVTLRRLANGIVVPLALAVLCLTPFAVIYALEIKHYVIEFLTTAVVLYFSVRLAEEPDRRESLCFLGAAVFCILFSFTAPIVIGACGIGVLVHVCVSARPGHDRAALLRISAALAVSGAIFLIYYVGYARPVTAVQFASWKHVYEPYMLNFSLGGENWATWLRLPAFIRDQFDLDGLLGYKFARYVFGPALLVSLAVGIVVTGSRFVFLPVAAAAAVALIYGLSLLGLLPIQSARHFAFLPPLIGILLAIGAYASLRRVVSALGARRAKAAAAMCACAVIGILAVAGLKKAGHLEREQLTPLIAHMLAHGPADTPAFVYYSAQPAMALLAPKTLRRIGLVDHGTGTPSWDMKWRDFPNWWDTSDTYFAFYRDAIRGHDDLWLVFSHTWVERSFSRYLRIAEEEVGPCAEALRAIDAYLFRCRAERRPSGAVVGARGRAEPIREPRARYDARAAD